MMVVKNVQRVIEEIETIVVDVDLRGGNGARQDVFRYPIPIFNLYLFRL